MTEWFRKKKVCPICRSKHKGAPRSVRVADHTIDVLVAQLLLPEAKAERLQRIQRIDEEQRGSDSRKQEKERAKLALLMQKQIGQQAALALAAAMSEEE